MTQRAFVAVAVTLLLVCPARALGQSATPPVSVGGLLRAGVRAVPEGADATDGFGIFDARVRFKGKIGIVFDYYLQTLYNPDSRAFELLDAEATLSLLPQVEISFGMGRPPFGYEALQSKGSLSYLERSQAVTAIAPGRQIGMQGEMDMFDGRVTVGAGLFNGNGRAIENDGNNYLFASRVQYNSIGTIAFYDDFVIQVGGSFGYSSDTEAPLGRGIVTGDPAAVPRITTAFAGKRLLWGADFQLSYRTWTLTAEYLRGDYDLAHSGRNPGSRDTEAHGGYAELGYRAWGVLEGIVRYDGFHPALGSGRTFLVFGANVYPGYYAKLGLQYATALRDSPDSETLADGQFFFVAQVDF